MHELSRAAIEDFFVQTFDVDNNVIEFVESRYRSDRYLFRMLLELNDTGIVD